MYNKKCVLGIDTSNYTTSVAIVDDNYNIIADERKKLTVKQGDRGLRQSNALFQHIENIPELIYDAFSKNIEGCELTLVSVSSKPRPLEGSYMPVFKAGISAGKSIAAACSVPYVDFSHQEGHIEAVKHFSAFNNDNDEFLCWHISGGTCDILKVKYEKGCPESVNLIGGSKDISFGQLLDRTGVAMGMPFPSGGAMDEIASKAFQQTTGRLKNISVNSEPSGVRFNLSGIETQCRRMIISIQQGRNLRNIENKHEKVNFSIERSSDKCLLCMLIKEIFEKIAECIIEASVKASEITGINKVLISGGVASSKTIRNIFSNKHFITRSNVSWLDIVFGEISLSSDNAVGTAILGGKKKWL